MQYNPSQLYDIEISKPGFHGSTDIVSGGGT